MSFLSNQTPDNLNKRATVGQTLSQISNMPVTTGQAISAGIEEAFQGTATTGQVADYFSVLSAEKTGTQLSKEDYEKSGMSDPNIAWYKGMTDKSLAVSYDRQQKQYARDFIASKAPITSFASTLGASFADPVNLGVSALTLGSGGVLSKIPKVASMAKSLSRTQRLTAGIVAESAVGATITGVGASYMGQKTGDEYGVADTIIDATVGAGLSLGARKIGDVYQNYRLNNIEKGIAQQATDAGLNGDYILATIGTESSFNSKAVNKNTGAFGYYQFLPSTAEQYGITPNSTIQEQTDAFIRFTNDNKAILEKSLKRDVDNVDLYMAHWLGAGGASKVLQYKNDVKFLDIPDIDKIYDNPEAVLTQNGLPRDATIGQMKRSRADRMARELRAKSRQQNFNQEMDLLVRTDHATAKALNDDPVTFHELNAQELSTISKDADNFLKKFNEDFDRTIAETEAKIASDDADLGLLRAENIAKIELANKDFQYQYAGLATKAQELFKDIFDFKTDPIDFYAEVDHKAYADVFNELNVKKQQYNDIALQIENVKNNSIETPVKEQLKPLHRVLSIDPQGQLAKDLRAYDITPKTAIGLFKKGGATDADRIIPSQYPEYFIKDDGAGYADRNDLIDKIVASFNKKNVNNLQKAMSQSAIKKTITKDGFIDVDKFFEKNEYTADDILNILKRSSYFSKGQLKVIDAIGRHKDFNKDLKIIIEPKDENRYLANENHYDPNANELIVRKYNSFLEDDNPLKLETVLFHELIHAFTGRFIHKYFDKPNTKEFKLLKNLESIILESVPILEEWEKNPPFNEKANRHIKFYYKYIMKNNVIQISWGKPTSNKLLGDTRIYNEFLAVALSDVLFANKLLNSTLKDKILKMINKVADVFKDMLNIPKSESNSIFDNLFYNFEQILALQNIDNVKKNPNSEILNSLKQQLDATKADIQSNSAALSQMNQDFKQSINKFINDTFQEQIKGKKTFIDYEAAAQIDATTDYIDSLTDSDVIKSLETDIERLKNEGVLDEEMTELVNRIYENDDALVDKVNSSIKGCLLGGGGE